MVSQIFTVAQSGEGAHIEMSTFLHGAFSLPRQIIVIFIFTCCTRGTSRRRHPCEWRETRDARTDEKRDRLFYSTMYVHVGTEISRMICHARFAKNTLRSFASVSDAACRVLCVCAESSRNISTSAKKNRQPDAPMWVEVVCRACRVRGVGFDMFLERQPSLPLA